MGFENSSGTNEGGLGLFRFLILKGNQRIIGIIS